MQKIRYSFDQNNKVDAIHTIFTHVRYLGYTIITHDIQSCELIVEVIEMEKK